MLRYGPAGIPLSCKGRNIRDGIEDIHALGLHCMEIQLVRGKYVDELDDFEELGAIAQSLDIHMGIHAPYYMDFLGNGYMRNKSKKFLEKNEIRQGGLFTGLVTGLMDYIVH